MNAPGHELRRLADAAVRDGRLAELDALVREIDPASANALQAALTNGFQVREKALGADGPRVLSLAELLTRPELLEPPETVVPYLGYRGRVVMLAGREKDGGKTTAASAGAAALTDGRSFLGQPTARGTALILAVEEHLGDVTRRLHAFGADPARTFILDRVEDPIADLDAAVCEVGPDFVVIDTLTPFVAPLGLESGSAADWTPVMAGISRVARDSDAAILVLHHANKLDGTYRDSTAIGAAVDVILEAKRGPEGTVQVKAKGRFPVEDFDLRLMGTEDSPRLELAGGGLGLDARILFYVDRHPGASKRAVREAVQGRAKDIGSTIDLLLDRGVLRDGGDGTGCALYSNTENPHGTAAEPPGTTPGTGGAGNRRGSGSRDPRAYVVSGGREPPPEPAGDLDDFDSAVGWPS